MTPNDLSKRLAHLSREEKARLFERLQGQKGGTERIGRRPPGSGAPPLSFAQQRVWFLDRLAPGDTSYNLPSPIRIKGELHPAALERALAVVAARHESLRTTFGMVGGEAVQVIDNRTHISLPLVDLSRLGLGDFATHTLPPELLRLLAGDERTPFDLARGPLLRATLIRFAPESHALILTMHHAVSDGWSMSILVREAVACYLAALAGTRVDLPEPPIQYADYAVWQRRTLTGKTLAAHLEHWRGELAGVPEIVDLPWDRPRPPVKTFPGGRHRFTLPAEVAARVRQLARASGGTPFMTLLAAFFALLGRYSGQLDVAVGTAVANRQRAELEGVIGFFANTLVLRGRLAGDPTFRELAARTRQGTLAAQAHQDLPFEKLVEELKPARDPSRSPLFQVMFVFENTPAADYSGAGRLIVEPLQTPGLMSKFDLSLALREEGDALRGVFSWNTDLFDRATVARLSGHFVNLLTGALEQPERRLSQLPLLAPAELVERIAAGHGAAVTARPPLFHEEVTGHARRTPDAVAVTAADTGAGEGAVTYGELVRRAAAGARRLRRAGVGPEVVVGVALDRSPELVTALLAIWQAGGVYLPLDPAYPAERLAFMLDNSGAALVLSASRETLPAGVPALTVGELMEAGPPEENELAEPSAQTDRWNRSDATAYIIYTSGSTGRPKGVAMPYASLADLASRLRSYGAGPGSRALLFFSPSFDASLADVTGPLAAGGTLVTARRERLLGRDLAELLARERLTHAMFAPSVLAALPPVELPELRQIGVGGEVCTPELAARWGAGRCMWNLYGPTEASVYVTAADVTGGIVDLGEVVPGSEVHLLDRHGNPVPAGAVGEMCLGGRCLARGYFGRPDLTAERFVPHPFPLPGQEGDRLYRTGDLGRRTAAGRLDILGRIDEQVKVRGFRIELEEVETVLRRQPGVAEAAVVVRRDAQGGGATLAAFLVPGQAPLEIEALRQALRSVLPEYMVPGSFTAVETLPRTPSGKVDRKALAARAPERERGTLAGGEPGSQLEREIAALWCELLGLPEVGMEENFFDLGGHSILLTQLHVRLMEPLGRDLPLLALFEHPTVRALAHYLAGSGEGAGEPPAEASRDRASRQREGFDLQRRRQERTRT